ncbi:putative ribonuclease H-like domain-containing protein [Tanacetum coccineum]
MYLTQYKDANTLFATIQTRFGGNEATKKTQETLLKQMYENFSAPRTKSLDFIFNRLQKIKMVRKISLSLGGHVVWTSPSGVFHLPQDGNFAREYRRTYETKADCNYHQRERVVSGNNYTRVNYNYSTKKAHHSAHKNMVLRAVLMKTGLRPLNTARPVNTAHPKTIGHLQKEDQGYVDSGCSRQMIGNMSYLSDFKEFDGGYVTFGRGAKGRKITVPRKNNMYSVDINNIVPKESLTCLVAKATLDELMIWHRRLGHVNFKTINKLVKENLVRGLPLKRFENDQTCVACLKGKKHKASSSKDETSGILKRTLIEAARTMLDDSKLHTTFWAKAVNTAFYVQNRVLVVKPHNKTSYELFRGRTPALSFMRPFGCHVTIPNTVDYLFKFDGKSDEGFVVGYSLHSKDFRVYNIRTRKVEKNLHIRFLEDKPIIAGGGPKWLFDIDVLTKLMNYVPVVACTNSSNFEGTEESIGAGHSSKETRSSQDYILMPLWKDGSLFDSSSKNASNDEPQPSSEAGKKDDEGVSKESGIDDQEMPENSTQDVNTAGPSVNTEPDMFSLGENSYTCSHTSRILWKNPKGLPKLFFRNKKDEKGIVIWNKARLVEQGHTQEEGIDYDEVFAPLARIEVVRLFLAYASFMGFMVYQMDVKSAFLYGKIEEEVYVCQPLGFEDLDYPDKVYKVVKAHYGLHQALRAYYETLAKYLLDNGFHKGKIDQTLFIKKQKGDILLVRVYVDDIIFGSTKMELCTEFEKLMHDKSMIGSLMYLTSSRPAIMFTVCACARFQVTPKVSHLHAVKRTSRLISWQCKKQIVVAASSTEAKYVAATSCCGQESVVPQLISPTQTPVADEAASTGVDVRYGGATTTFTGLEAGHDKGNIDKTPTMPHDSPLPRGNTLGSNEGSMTQQELMVFCTTLSKKVESLETELKQIKQIYGATYTRLIKKDPSKQGRKIAEIDQDPGISLEVSTAEKDVSTALPISTAGAAVTSDSVAVSTSSPTRNTGVSMTDDITMGETLVYIKKSAAKDKGKGKMVESKTVQTKTKLQQEQERLDFEAAVRLQAELEEEERVEADEELVQKLQVEEREKYIEAEQARMLAELIN